MPQHDISSVHYEQTLEVNRVLKNTYLLLSLTLMFSASTAWYAMVTNAAPVGLIGLLIGWFGLYFLTVSLRESAWGILAIFAFTGFTGYTLGPILNLYINNFSNGSQIIAMSLGSTGAMFFGLSGYVLTSRKDFSYMGGFIAVAAMSAFLLGLASAIFAMPMLNLLVAFAFTIISSAFILFHTSMIINGGERNYIMATIGLYVALFNLFVSLLRIFGALAGNRD